MAEPASQASDGSTPKLSAPKDKNCPYCGQAFTSSSLGRHLDLYIKEKNPKAPDGIHDVDAIRKMRGGITRRQPRGSIGARRDGSTPTGTPRPAPKRDSSGQETDGYRSPAMRRDGFATESNIKFTTPFQPTWEATGVMNDIPRKGNWEGEDAQEPNRRPGMQRTVSKQTIQKAQFDVKQKLADAMDTARAAELALRELVSSWRAAKLQIDNNSMPFDFDPLSLDFPALTLQCLQPPPTLFSSTQHPTSTSWSVQSPGQREFTALQAFFQEEFRTWKLSCASATTTAAEEFAYPPSTGPFRDVREAVRKAEKSAENLEAQVNEHLQSAYAVWDSLPAQRQQEVWVLELARSVGRKHKETEKMKQFQHKLKQENANLKSQIDQLNRLQQPREFKISPPVTIPMERELLNTLLEFGVQSGGKGVGFSLEDRHVDLGTIVSKSIERWKSVIASNRASVAGMNAQRSLDQSAQNTGFTTINGPAQAQQQKNQPQQQPAQISVSVVKTPQQPMQQQQLQQAQQAQQQKQQQQQQQQAQQQQMQTSKRLSNASTNGMTSEQATNSTNTTAPPSVEEEISDEDADAEMEDDDSFAIMNTSPVKAAQPMQQQATLEVPRTRGPVQQRNAADHRFMMPNGTGGPVGRASINLSRSMPNMNIAMQNAAAMQAADMTMAMQGVRGDPMYME